MRPDWDIYFLDMAKLVASRSTCLRAKHGAVLVKDRHVLATGYNGAPSGLEHCHTCLRQQMNIPPGERYEICRSVHAEMNCIVQAAKRGAAIDGATLYVTGQPCHMCSRLIITGGVKRVVFEDTGRYTLTNSDYLRKAGLDVVCRFPKPEGS